MYMKKGQKIVKKAGPFDLWSPFCQIVVFCQTPYLIGRSPTFEIAASFSSARKYFRKRSTLQKWNSHIKKQFVLLITNFFTPVKRYCVAFRLSPLAQGGFRTLKSISLHQNCLSSTLFHIQMTKFYLDRLNTSKIKTSFDPLYPPTRLQAQPILNWSSNLPIRRS